MKIIACPQNADTTGGGVKATAFRQGGEMFYQNLLRPKPDLDQAGPKA